jgi:hypothetical protein
MGFIYLKADLRFYSKLTLYYQLHSSPILTSTIGHFDQNNYSKEINNLHFRNVIMSNDKAQKSKSDSWSLGKKIRGDNNQPKVNCIIQYKDPKPSDESIKAKFTESDGAEVSKVIRGYKTSDNQANLVLLMNRMVTLGDLYDMFENGKSKKLAQTMSRALDGQVRDDWIEIINDVDNWENDNKKQEFIRLLKRLGSEAFGPKAFKNQCKAMESGMLKIPESNLRVGTYRLIQINKMLPYLGLQAKSYDIGDLNKIIVKSLSPKAMGRGYAHKKIS